MAAPSPWFEEKSLPDEVKVKQISPLIQGGIRIAFILAVIITFVYLVWGGIQWITSGGDKTKYEEARNKITAALVGLALIALAYLILRLAIHFLGFQDVFQEGFNIPAGYIDSEPMSQADCVSSCAGTCVEVQGGQWYCAP